MLPDFPELKARLQHLAEAYFKSQVRSEGIIAEISEAPLFEGDSVPSISTNGQRPLEEVSAGVAVDRMAIVEKGHQAYIESLQPAIEEFKRRISEMTFRAISEASVSAGNSLDAGGQGFTQDLFLSVLERIEIPLGPDGNLDATGLRFFAAPDLAEKMNERLEEWKEDKKFQARLQELADKKRAEQVDQESDRRLVD